MAILGISSATKTVSVGLVDDGKIVADFSYSGKEAFTEDLITYIESLFLEVKAKITAIAVASGPGSYNGLRGGLATAKTIAQVLNVPILSVSTLEAIAYNLRNTTATILSVTNARRDEFNFALFSSSHETISRITSDQVMKLDKMIAVLSKVQGELYLCGETEDVYAELTRSNKATKIRLAPKEFSIAKGIYVALIGDKLLQEGIIANPMTLSPKYSVEPNIREFKKKPQTL